jgi:hypothetical protein
VVERCYLTGLKKADNTRKYINKIK